jgi:hypothetical protein
MFDAFTSEEAAEATTTLLGLAQVTAERLDPDAMLPSEAMAQLQVVAKARKALAAVEMGLSARVANSEQWKGDGSDTAAERIAKETGKSKKQARDDLDTARRAKENERLDRAMKNGDVSPEQAKAIGAAGAADPSATESLLDLAERGTSLGDLNEEAERIRREAEGEEHKRRARARAHAGRFARSWTKEEMFFLMLGNTTDVGAQLLAALDVERDHVFARDRANGTKSTFENRTADALINLILGRSAAHDLPTDAESPAETAPGAEAAPDAEPAPTSHAVPAPTTAGPSAPTPAPSADGEAHDDAEQQDLFTDPDEADGEEPAEPAAPLAPAPTGPRPSGGGAGGSPPATGPPPPRRRSGPPPKSTRSGRMVARLDVAHLWGEPGEATCEIAGIGTVSLDAMSAALPDPWIQLVITRGKDVLNVTNIGRGADLWQQAALDWTHRGRCTNLACNRTIQIQNDHRTPWAHEQVTELHNLDPLCTPDHRKKTHHGWALIEGTGRRAFVPPDDPRHPDHSDHEQRKKSA